MPEAGTPIRVLYVYGAAERSGGTRIGTIRDGLTRAGFAIDDDDFLVVDWGRFATNPREEDRRALLDDRFGATDAEAQALLRSVVWSKVPRNPLVRLIVGALFLDKLDLLTPYRSVADLSYPVLIDLFAYMRNTRSIVDPVIASIRSSLETTTKPVIAIGLSLGGIILVDALSQWRVDAPAEAEAARRQLRLLTTVGSQSPMLHACNALLALRRDGPATATPFVPWLNIWRRLDVLSYPARPMFDPAVPGEAAIRDVILEAGPTPQVFPEAHGTYFDDEQVYAEIRQMYSPPLDAAMDEDRAVAAERVAARPGPAPFTVRREANATFLEI